MSLLVSLRQLAGSELVRYTFALVLAGQIHPEEDNESDIDF